MSPAGWGAVRSTSYVPRYDEEFCVCAVICVAPDKPFPGVRERADRRGGFGAESSRLDPNREECGWATALASGEPADPTELGRVNATYRLSILSQRHPQLQRAAARARLDFVAAVIATGDADGVPGRHNLQEQADVEQKLRVYGQALADMVRGEAIQ